MKYLRKFENIEHEFVTGDYVVLILESDYSREFNYNIGDLCVIILVDNNDDKFPYQIELVGDDNFPLWVHSYQIRRATQEDIDMNKYNL